MLRIPAFIAVLTLIGTTGASAEQGVAKSGALVGCYNSQQCVAICNKNGGRTCEFTCQKRATMLPPCK